MRRYAERNRGIGLVEEVYIGVVILCSSPPFPSLSLSLPGEKETKIRSVKKIAEASPSSSGTHNLAYNMQLYTFTPAFHPLPPFFFTSIVSYFRFTRVFALACYGYELLLNMYI